MNASDLPAYLINLQKNCTDLITSFTCYWNLYIAISSLLSLMQLSHSPKSSRGLFPLRALSLGDVNGSFESQLELNTHSSLAHFQCLGVIKSAGKKIYNFMCMFNGNGCRVVVEWLGARASRLSRCETIAEVREWSSSSSSSSLHPRNCPSLRLWNWTSSCLLDQICPSCHPLQYRYDRQILWRWWV